MAIRWIGASVTGLALSFQPMQFPTTAQLHAQHAWCAHSDEDLWRGDKSYLVSQLLL